MTLSAEQVATNKTVQQTEANQRAGAPDPNLPPVDPVLNAGALDVIDDTPTGDPGDGRQPQARDPAEPADPTPRRAISPSDEARANIVANFRKNRGTVPNEAAEDAREIRALTREGIPQELSDAIAQDEEADDLLDVDAPSLQPRQAEEPQRFKLVVRGEDRWLTLEEMQAEARKSLAHDDYVGEGRQLLDEVKRLKEDLAARTAQTGKPPAGEGAEYDTQSQNPDEPPVDPFKEVADTLLYGDPEKAGAQLKELISKAVPAMAKEESARERRSAEHARSMRTLSDFSEANPDIAQNQMASAAVRAGLFEQQFADLVKMGMDPAKLPRNDPNALANMHLTFRSDPMTSHLVRSTDKLLEAAKGDFMKWRGTEKGDGRANGQPVAGTNVAAQPGRVEVNVDRTLRRAAIPQQPARTAVVRLAQPAAPQPKSRSQVVLDMQRQRGQLRA